MVVVVFVIVEKVVVAVAAEQAEKVEVEVFEKKVLDHA